MTRLGISGWRRNLTAAVASNGRVAACEEGRLRRVREMGAATAGWPAMALNACARELGLRLEPADWTAAEPEFAGFSEKARVIDHHEAHARTAFHTSGHKRAVVVVCDSSPSASESLWIAGDNGLERLPCHGAAQQIAARLTEAGDPRELEFIARDPREGAARQRVLASADEVLRLIDGAGPANASLPICAGGGLFLNGFINLRIRQAGYDLHVPPDPRNGGLAVGCALSEGNEPRTPGPFLGPSFSDDEIKRVLDNCKLRYDYVSQHDAINHTVKALLRGQLIAWFQGPMEWGPRALGNRSILANPFARYVSDNLNTFLKHRPSHHTYPVSILDEDRETLLLEQVNSPYMESEAPIRPEGPLASITQGGDHIRVQTVGQDGSRLRSLLATFKAAAGHGVLINTSFNGFHEPIVASPRDAVRVFYGTGLDALWIGSFWLEK